MIRVLVVDDSMFMRAAISRTLTATGAFTVIGQARDGQEALRLVRELAPDVVTMDFNMPGWTGADTVREIMSTRPTPIVMFSAHTVRGAKETLDALRAGAVEFVTKPAGEVSADLSKVQDELVRKLTMAAVARPRTPPPDRAAPISGKAKAPGPASAPSSVRGASALTRVCVIGVSTGGPVALSQLLPALPADTKFGVVVVQHMPAHFTKSLADRLDLECALEVREAQTGDRPRPGLVLIAPGDHHLEFEDRGTVTLNEGPLVHGCRPAADVTMISAAKVFGRRAMAVVMTGMGRDGTAGALAIRRADGRTLAQDEASSVIFGMPKSAIEAGAIEEVSPLDEIAERLRYL